MKESFSAQRLTKETAGLVGELFQLVYGAEYPAAYVYDPNKLWLENELGNTYSVLAFNGDHKAIGHLAIFRSAPNPKVYEMGQLLVLPQYRGCGIGDDLTQYVSEVLVKEVGVDNVFCESVSIHTLSQNKVAKRGYVDTALEVDLMPAEAYVKEKSSSGRVACILQFQEQYATSQSVYIPSCYFSELNFLYEGLADRQSQEAPPFITEEIETIGQEKIYDFAGVAKSTIETIGSDFSSYVLGLEKLAQNKRIQAMQVYLPLTDAAVGGAVDILREHGFFLGGILPGWFGGDGLMMQKLWTDSPNFADIHLYTDKARKILDLIQEDWDRSKGVGRNETLA